MVALSAIVSSGGGQASVRHWEPIPDDPHACSIAHLKVPFAGFRSFGWYKGKPASTTTALSVVSSYHGLEISDRR
jgi:hypothetical protein